MLVQHVVNLMKMKGHSDVVPEDTEWAVEQLHVCIIFTCSVLKL